MKKVLSLVLVIAMVLSSMSFAFAGTFTDIADTDYEKAVETLTALGVVTGYEDGTFRPEKVVTRAEMAKLIVEILGYGDLVAGSKSNFSDTQGHWADAWVALAAGKGLVIGTGDGKFTPDRTVSYDEAITMVVRALGYTDGCNEIKNMTWPTNFKVKAAELGLTKDVKLVSTGADRGGVAQLLFNALSSTLVTVDVDGNVVYIVDKNDNQKELLSRIATLNEEFKVTTAVVDPKNKNFAGELVDLAPYMFQELKVYLNDDDQVVYVKGTNSLVVEGEIDDVTDNSAKTLVTVAIENATGKIEKVTFAAESTDDITDDIFENGAIKTNDKTFADLKKTETIKIVADDKDGNGKIDGKDTVLGFVLTQQTKVAQIESEYVEGKTKLDVFALPTDDGDVDLDNVTVTGAVSSLEDIEEDDVVVEYKSDDDTVTKLVVSRDTVDGKVTRIDNTNFYIDGTKYSRNGLVSEAWELGDEGVFFLDHNGKIVAFDGEAGATTYAVIIGKDVGTKEEAKITGKVSVDDYPLIRLATQEDEAINYEVAVTLNSDGSIKSAAKVDKKALLTTPTDKTSDITFTGDMLANDTIIKYSLDKDGRISKISTVKQSVITSKDTEKLVFASNAVIFDANDDDYALANIDRLEDTLVGNDDIAVYNASGEIVVLFTDNVKESSDTTYAYISKINPASNGGENVQLVVTYMNGVKIERYTDGSDVVDEAYKKSVVAVDLDGEVIIDVDDIATSLIVETTTASAVYAKTGRVVLANNTSAYLSEDATIITIEKDGDIVLSDLNDIYAKETVFDVYFNADDEVAFIVIHE